MVRETQDWREETQVSQGRGPRGSGGRDEAEDKRDQGSQGVGR